MPVDRGIQISVRDLKLRDLHSVLVVKQTELKFLSIYLSIVYNATETSQHGHNLRSLVGDGFLHLGGSSYERP